MKINHFSWDTDYTTGGKYDADKPLYLRQNLTFYRAQHRKQIILRQRNHNLSVLRKGISDY